MKYTTLFIFLTVLALTAVLPEAAFAAEEAAGVNPPGWVGGFLAGLSLVLAIATSIWARSKKL